MAKIKLAVSATVEETFKDFLISRKTKGLADKTLQSYEQQFRAVARHIDVKMDIAMLQKADLDEMIIRMRDAGMVFYRHTKNKKAQVMASGKTGNMLISPRNCSNNWPIRYEPFA